MNERPKPPVVRRCRACVRAAMRRKGGELIVSASGLEHFGGHHGVTLCGKDATGDAWWWPL